MTTLRIIGALLLMSTMAHAQEYGNNAQDLMRQSTFDRYVTFSMSAQYGVALPMGGQANYIDKISPANFVLQGDWSFPGHFTLGLKSGYQYNQQRLPRSVEQFGDETVSAVQTRTLTTIPALATLGYAFTEPSAALRPYVQIGAGGAFVNYSNFFGTLVDQKAQFAGAVAPAVGLKFYGKRDRGLGGEIQAQYQQVFFKYAQINNSPSVLLSAGLTYRFY